MRLAGMCAKLAANNLDRAMPDPDEPQGYSRRMLVVSRNGRRFEVSGWRAWLLALGSIVGVIAGFLLLAVLLTGLALTIGAVLLIVVPVAIVYSLINTLINRRP
jgi:hypothetical protein